MQVRVVWGLAKLYDIEEYNEYRGGFKAVTSQLIGLIDFINPCYLLNLENKLEAGCGGSQRQEDCESETSLGYIVWPCLKKWKETNQPTKQAKPKQIKLNRLLIVFLIRTHAKIILD
jgi:hypothetical protein